MKLGLDITNIKNGEYVLIKKSKFIKILDIFKKTKHFEKIKEYLKYTEVIIED